MPSLLPSRRALNVLLGVFVLTTGGCSDGESRRAAASSPTSPTSVASTGGEPGPVSISSVIDRSPNVAMDVTFPPRNEPLLFRQQLETTYRDGLRRSPTTSFVDLEGTIVWTQEYLRYRVNGCNNTDATTRVQAQIEGRGVQPVCADFSGTTVNFPPRNEPFAFRQELERIYRDTLRRTATQTFVDPEGDIVWTQEYLRYRLNRCSHTEATDRVLVQVNGGPVQPTCDGTPVTPSGPITSFVSGVTADGATATLVPSPRPNAGAGPIVSGLTNSGNAITVTSSTPIDRLIVSVNTTTSAPGRLTPMAVLGAFYEIRLPSPRSIAVVVLQIVPGTAQNFSVEIAAGLGGGPIGNYFAQPAAPRSDPVWRHNRAAWKARFDRSTATKPRRFFSRTPAASRVA